MYDNLETDNDIENNNNKNNNTMKYVIIVLFIFLIILSVGIVVTKIIKNKAENENSNIIENNEENNVTYNTFESESYSCEVGNEINVKIDNYDERYFNYLSSDNDEYISFIQENDNVKVQCLKEGLANLSMYLTTGETRTTSIDVAANSNINPTASIKYSSSKYSCKVGETIYTTINYNVNDSIKSYSSNKPKIAVVEKSKLNKQADCADCLSVQIRCLKEGKATLMAESANGAKTTVEVMVTAKKTDKTPPTATFSPDGGTVKVGEFSSIIKVSDPSGVDKARYMLIKSDGTIVIDTQYVTLSTYQMNLQNITEEGYYYLRVSAIDKLGNETKDWIQSKSFKLEK